VSDSTPLIPNLPDQAPAPPSACPEPPRDLVDCWNQIGVGGDRSCPELDKVVLCRNCPAFVNAGLKLLNRAPPPHYRRQWTEYVAESRKTTAAHRSSAVIFRLGLEWLALPTQAFQEIAEQRSVHTIPHRRHGLVLGLVNVRGELLVCVSLARLLGLDRGSHADSARTFYDRFLVVGWDDKRLVFPADEVRGIHRFQPADLARSPNTVAKSASTFTEGMIPWDDQMVGLLEPETLFSTLNRSLS
jgi:chemotaxis-related protein WspD